MRRRRVLLLPRKKGKNRRSIQSRHSSIRFKGGFFFCVCVCVEKLGNRKEQNKTKEKLTEEERRILSIIFCKFLS